MTPIVFSVRGLPKGQPRPRAFVRKTSFGPIARVYDSATAEGWKSEIALAARPFIPAQPLSGPLAVTIEFWMPRPLDHFPARNRKNGLKPGVPEFHTIVPDADNLAKAVLDCLSRLRIWEDDDQVSKLTVTKRYEDPASGTGASIHVERPRGYLEAKPTEQLALAGVAK